MVSWSRLIRYENHQGQIQYGEPMLSNPGSDMIELIRKGVLQAKVCEGISALSVQPTDRIETVRTLLAPLTEAEIPYVRCVGLNYKSHILETNRPLPENPTTFSKPGTAISGPLSPISAPKIAQSQLDYEGELVIVIGRDAKNVSETDALDYVAAYTVGNDVSARDWQREPGKAGPIPQWTFSKSFDGFAPLGPCLVSTAILGAADDLALTTQVNGEVRQRGQTGDLCFGVKKLVEFCSQGQTLQRGSLIMTGTPGGVGLFMTPPQFLKDGDVVEVEISGIGRIENHVQLE